jgi:2-acylglycerol O-acyltransferase 2
MSSGALTTTSAYKSEGTMVESSKDTDSMTAEESHESSKMFGDKKLPPLRPRFSFWRELFMTAIAVVLMPMYTVLLSMIVYGVMVYYTPYLWLRTLILLYIPYILWWDSSPENGARPFRDRSACRSKQCFKWFAQYFDMTLVKTCDLDPTKHYIMLYHPHGVISLGANLALNTNGCDFESVFPSLERAGVTLNEAFHAPLLREWSIRLGYIGPNKHTLREALDVQSIVLVPGGAAEALHSRPGIMKFYLKNRKGFVKLALETKCPLVPCIGFGENEIYHCTESGQLQRRLCKVMKFSIPFLKHVVPRRAKVTVVVGEPIEFGNETNVGKCHEIYLQHLKDFYNKERVKYGYANIDLEVI